MFLRYNNQDIFNKGFRGAARTETSNWMKTIVQRKSGARGLFVFQSTKSLELFTIGKNGSP